ncbi:hypothetical protein HK105_205336, partial [Polyrhizophydium stewartii]
MGLPHLRRWLKQTVPRCFGELNPKSPAEFDHVFLDINGMLHQRANKASEGNVMSRFVGSLNRMLLPKKIVARRQVYLAVDGPAPMAKMILQRQRRAEVAGRRARKRQSGFDKRKITTGCIFMDLVDDYLAYFAAQQLVFKSNRNSGLAIVVDGSASPGEGELKIIHTIRGMQATDACVDSYAIISSDGDIILQAIVSGVSCTVVSDSVNETFKVQAFFDQLHARFPGRNVQRVAHDFAVLVLLAGNDYLPKLRHASLQETWSLYTRLAKSHDLEHLVDLDASTFNFRVLYKILDAVSRKDKAPKEAGSSAEVIDLVTDESDSESDEIMMISDGEGDAESDEIMMISEGEDGDGAPAGQVFEAADLVDEQAAEAVAAKVQVDQGFKPQVREAPSVPLDRSDTNLVRTYLAGVLWCMEMYRTGQCGNYVYVYPWKHAPSATQIKAVISRGQAEGVVASRSAEPPLPPAVCAAMILPPECKSFMDPRMQPLVDVFQSLTNKEQAAQTMRDAHNQILRHNASVGAPIDKPTTAPFVLTLFRPTSAGTLPGRDFVPKEPVLLRNRMESDMPTTIHLVEGVTGGFVPPRMRKRITIELHDDGGTHITKEERSDEAEGGFQRLRSADGVSATQVRALADDAVAAFQTLPHEDPVGGEDLYRLDTTIMIDSGSFKWQNTPNRGCNITPSA